MIAPFFYILTLVKFSLIFSNVILTFKKKNLIQKKNGKYTFYKSVG